MYKSSDLYWNSLAIPKERCIVWKNSFHYDSINILYHSLIKSLVVLCKPIIHMTLIFSDAEFLTKEGHLEE